MVSIAQSRDDRKKVAYTTHGITEHFSPARLPLNGEGVNSLIARAPAEIASPKSDLAPLAVDPFDASAMEFASSVGFNDYAGIQAPLPSMKRGVTDFISLEQPAIEIDPMRLSRSAAARYARSKAGESAAIVDDEALEVTAGEAAAAPTASGESDAAPAPRAADDGELAPATDETDDLDDDSTAYHNDDNRGIVWSDPDGCPTQLTTFCARIVENVRCDSGDTSEIYFRVEMWLPGRPHIIETIKQRDFSTLDWPSKTLGIQASIRPMKFAKDRVRHAISVISGTEVPWRTIYQHTGWRDIEGQRLFLTAGGAIGAAGHQPNVRVDLPLQLANYDLPAPPIGDDLIAATRASLRALDFAQDYVSFPLLSSVYRSVLGPPCDFAIHVAGSSGLFKSEACGIIQRHFGPKFGRLSLPGSWSSTANSLETTAYLAKDVVYTIDDFVPKGSPREIAELQQKADRIFRGQGNAAGRGRMKADATLNFTRYPRGLILSSGEDVPGGESVRARLLVIDIERGSIPSASLSRVQKSGDMDLYPAATAGFIHWLARNQTQTQEGIKGLTEIYRARFTAMDCHARTPGILADLAMSFSFFCEFARESGAITAEEEKSLVYRNVVALKKCSSTHQVHHVDSDPIKQFFELLMSAISSGRAYLAETEDGLAPPNPGAWGWVLVYRDNNPGNKWKPDRIEQWQPRGEKVGWMSSCGELLLLDLNACCAVTRAFSERSGASFGLPAKTLAKRLAERGLLVEGDSKDDRLTVRMNIEGDRRRVHRVKVTTLRGEPLK